MKEFIEKLIGRLEEYKTKSYVTGITNNPYEFGACNGMDSAIEIVKELAEEFDGEALRKSQKIYNYIKQEINPYGKPFDGTVYEFGLKVMKYIENFHTEELAEEYINTSTNSSSGWIPCKVRLPEAEERVLIFAKRKYKGGGFRNIITTAIYEDGTVLENDSNWHWEDIDGEWDEEEDCYIIPEGWWEDKQYNPDGVLNYEVDDKVIAWMPLPVPYTVPPTSAWK